MSRGFEALTHSSCFKAPLASPWEELLSEEGRHRVTRVTHAADGPFLESSTESRRVERRSGELGGGGVGRRGK